MKESATSSQALMAVFFKQFDAAIVTRGTLETSAALNPQLGGQLTIIAESHILLGDITCIPDNVAPSLQRAIENAAKHLHESTVGKQMFTLFQMDRAIPFQPSYLDGLEALLRERDRLKAKKVKKGEEQDQQKIRQGFCGIRAGCCRDFYRCCCSCCSL